MKSSQQRVVLASFALLAIASAHLGERKGASKFWKAGKEDPDELSQLESCEALCEKHNKGESADSCMTRCSVNTDVAEDFKEGLKGFVEDEAYNEKGGKRMEKHAEEVMAIPIADCEPSVDATIRPEFYELDILPQAGVFDIFGGHGDGYITFEEASAWGEKACIPDEIIQQLFSETDTNRDKRVDREEFDRAGEDTALETELDEAINDEGSDQVNTADLPDFNVFDENGDGELEKPEVEEVFELEAERRNDAITEEGMDEVRDEVDSTIDELDTNGDHMLNEEEFSAGAQNDLGDEMQEQTLADEDLVDENDPVQEHPDEERPAEAATEAAVPEAPPAAAPEASPAAAPAAAPAASPEPAIEEALLEQRGRLRFARPAQSPALRPAAASVTVLARRFAAAQGAEANFLRRFEAHPQPPSAPVLLQRPGRGLRKAHARLPHQRRLLMAVVARARALTRRHAPMRASERWQAVAAAVALRKARG